MKTLKFQVVPINGMINVILYPLNEEAYLACLLLKREYITQEELLIFQKLGLQIELENKPIPQE